MPLEVALEVEEVYLWLFVVLTVTGGEEDGILEVDRILATAVDGLDTLVACGRAVDSDRTEDDRCWFLCFVRRFFSVL